MTYHQQATMPRRATPAIPWAQGFCPPTRQDMEEAVGSFPCAYHAAVRQRRQEDDLTATHHQINVRQCFDTQPKPLCDKPPKDDQDWLANVPEEGQTYEDYARYCCVQRSGRWKTKQTGVDRTGGIVLVPIIVSENDDNAECEEALKRAPDLAQLERFVDAYMGQTLPVKVLKERPAILKRHASDKSSKAKKSQSHTSTTRYEWIPPDRPAAASAPRRWVTGRVYENDGNIGEPSPAHRHAIDVEGLLTCLTDLVVPGLGAANGGTPHSVIGVLPVDDLYSCKSDLFIAGLAAGGSHVSAFSLHRYHPQLKMSPCHWWEYGYTKPTSKVDMYSYVQDDETIAWISEDDAASVPTKPKKRARQCNKQIKLCQHPPVSISHQASSEYLRRSAKLLVHELLHLLLFGHCIYYKCLMNGTGHLVEDFGAPSHLCGIDLRKLHFRLGFDVLRRYETLAGIWKDWGFASEAKWCQKQAERCRTALQNAPSPTANQGADVPEILDPK